jgi:hypothetical protein
MLHFIFLCISFFPRQKTFPQMLRAFDLRFFFNVVNKFSRIEFLIPYTFALQSYTMITDMDYQRLMDWAEELQKEVQSYTKEEALQFLIRTGVFDKDGNYTEDYPNLAAWHRANKLKKCTISDPI